ncbi:MAG: hypothetical protein H8E98_01170 [Bacteroidetes bacterium]|nr:hypothetical protein [Bacteroidota bacterium]
MDKNTIFLAYLDERDIMRDGFVELIELTDAFVKIKTNSGNVIVVPMHRVLKIKTRGHKDGDAKI